DRHPDMAARKTEPLIKALSVDTRVMRQQLDELAALATRLTHRPLHQLLADAAAATIGGHAYVFDQAARDALRTQARQQAALQAADHAPALLGDHELQIRIAIDPFERVVISCR